MKMTLRQLKSLIKEEIMNANPLSIDYLAQDKYINDFLSDHKKINTRILPAAVKAAMEAMIATMGPDECEDCQGTGQLDDEECDMCDGAGEFPKETTYGTARANGKRLYWIGQHDPTSPINPSGHEFFFDGSGQYVGFIES